LATKAGITAAFAVHNKAPCRDFAREATMTSEMTAFAIAVGGTSLVCYLLMTRMQNRRANRNAPRDGFLPDGGNYAAAEGWITSSRFGGDNPAFDSSGNPSDSAGGGGGGDGGGGGAGD